MSRKPVFLFLSMTILSLWSSFFLSREAAPGPEENPVPDTTLPAATAVTPAETVVSQTLSTEIPDSAGTIRNVLLIGTDGTDAEGPRRSDTMILCTLDSERERITMTSFLRDLYVPIPGHGSDRLNAAYAYGGPDLLLQTLEENFGLAIDGYVEVDFSHFSGIIDLLGGVTIDLRQDEAKAINKAVSGTLTAGPQLLSGQQALAYTRLRKLDADGDFSRTARQRTVLCALAKQLATGKLRELFSILKTLRPMVATDINSKDLAAMALCMLPALKNDAIVSQWVPADGTYQFQTIRGMAVLTADMETLRDHLRQSLESPDTDNADSA